MRTDQIRRSYFSISAAVVCSCIVIAVCGVPSAFSQTILFMDDFDHNDSTSITDPAARAAGTLSNTVKYNVTGVTAADEVAVTNGLLDWTGVSDSDGQVPANGNQKWTFRTTPGGATHLNWAPHVAGLHYEIRFTYRSAWSHPLTFGLSDDGQGGNWNADAEGDYDFAFGAYGSHWQSGEDGSSQNHGGASRDTEYDVVLKIDEAGGTAAAWVDGTLRTTRSIDFENAGRYFSFGEPTLYGGYIDNFTVSLFPSASLGGADTASGEATLRGELLGHGPANAYICWGENDGGTAGTSSWDHVVSKSSVSTGEVFSTVASNLYYGVQYEYRVYVTNAVGSHWSALGTFTTPKVLVESLFRDTFDHTLSTSITDPQDRAVGTLSSTVKYNVTGVTAADEVAVTNGLLDWTGVSDANGEVPGNGDQNWTFRTTPGGVTHFNWAPHVSGLYYEISFTYRSAWSHPLTFGLSDDGQGGDWNADSNGNYDFAFGAYGSVWQSGDDGASQNHGGAAADTEYDVVLKIDEAGGTAKGWVDGALTADRSIDFENAGRYFSFGSAGKYGGYIDDFEINELARFAITNAGAATASDTAELTGVLDAEGAVFTVRAYWSTSNNLTSAEWLADGTASNVIAGTYTNVTGHAVGASIDSLILHTTYYYTMVASNEVTEIWASPNESFIPVPFGTVVSVQ